MADMRSTCSFVGGDRKLLMENENEVDTALANMLLVVTTGRAASPVQPMDDWTFYINAYLQLSGMSMTSML